MTDAYAERGLSVRAVFEFEFSIGLRGADGDFEPAHDGPGYSDIALVRNHDFALDLLTAMEAQGLGLQQLHPEYADGQFEMSIAPSDPVGAADAAMVVRQTVRAIARRHGLTASFSPQVGPGTGNGAHVHLSLWAGDRNLMAGGDGPAGMQDRGEAFIAGILRELPALVAVAVPTCLGYLRLQPHHWSGAMQCWRKRRPAPCSDDSCRSSSRTPSPCFTMPRSCGETVAPWAMFAPRPTGTRWAARSVSR